VKKIRYEKKRQEKSITGGPFFGLTFFHSNWGNMNYPTRVIDQEELEKKFGYLDSEKDDWMQAWNFLAYIKNLKIFRVGKQEPVASFDVSNDLTSVTGAGNSMTFLNNQVTAITTATSVWNSVTNGASIYYHLNDIHVPQNEPTLGTNQLLFVVAKYPGTLGNEIGISIVNSDSNLKRSFVFKHDYSNVTSVSGITAGDTIYGSTTSAYGTIEQIIDSTIYFRMENGIFSAGETFTLNSTAIGTFSAINTEDDVENKVRMNQIFDRKIKEHEIGIVVSVENEIVESEIVSLDYINDNFIEDWNSDYLEFIVNENYQDPTDLAPASKPAYMLWETVNEKLLFGSSDSPSTAEIKTQLDKLKGETYGKYSVIFHCNIDVSEYIAENILSDERMQITNNNDITI